MTSKRTPRPRATPRAIGDGAVAAGMTLVPATEGVTQGDDRINETRDYIALYAARSGPLIDIFVGATDPGHKVGRVWIRPL